MLICIPSKGRPTNIKTLDLLRGYQKEKIFIFVEPQDYENYKRCNEDRATIINIRNNDMGISYVKNFILKSKRDIDYLWMIDDDIICLHSRIKFNSIKKYYHLNGIKEPKKIIEILQECYNDYKNNYNEYIQYGIPFRRDNVFVKENYKENDRICAFSLYNIKIIKELNLSFDNNCKVFEDYDFIAQYLLKGYKNIVNYKYAFSPIAFTKNNGGLENFYKDSEKSKKVCEYLLKKYEGYATMKYKEKINFYQIYLKWSKIKNARNNK